MSLKFIILTTKGIIRDQAVRRAAMLVIVLAALLMAVAGATFLSGWLAGDKWVFLIYWLFCAWLTLTAILLSIFDLLVVRVLLRREQRRLKREVFGKHDRNGEQ